MLKIKYAHSRSHHLYCATSVSHTERATKRWGSGIEKARWVGNRGKQTMYLWGKRYIARYLPADSGLTQRLIRAPEVEEGGVYLPQCLSYPAPTRTT